MDTTTVPEKDAVAAIDLLLTIGYIDGRLHEGEKALIRQYLDQLVRLAPGSAPGIDAAYAKLDAEIAGLAQEVVASGDQRYTQTKLKVRAVSLFRSFSPGNQEVALALMNAVIHADGTVSEHERELHDELLHYFHGIPSLPPHEAAAAACPPEMLRVEAVRTLPLPATGHPALDAIEHPYADDPAALHAQFTGDYNLIFQAITIWEQQRALGNGRLFGITGIEQLPRGTRLLDGHVYALRPSRPTELIVLGDLHGCYGCLKAAVLQSSFIERASRRRVDPSSPDVKLVLLGDYLDRGRFGFEGVLRGALHLLAMFPDDVIVLRGNHEYLVRAGDHICSAVSPAESVPQIAPRTPPGILEAYRHLFEHMPTALIFDRTLFVHGGIPRDDTMEERYKDLSSLGDKVMRFEMLWSDPEHTDTVPLELQRATPRFSFGHDQFRKFMTRIGCHTMVRGHEQVDGGFATTFDLGQHQLHTLFSAGGRDNPDLPAESRYRKVTPMALTVAWEAEDRVTATPWPIDYAPFANPAHNGLHR
ncbi:MAG: metallophosphoesterase [Deltaproteobacteria bacterium]|nr:metallophosphoesterase [Deltaproteobacteria bacterium]MCW5804928.1 metallophosphoesterase [Deltaproteobacteria bacterium]